MTSSRAVHPDGDRRRADQSSDGVVQGRACARPNQFVDDTRAGVPGSAAGLVRSAITIRMRKWRPGRLLGHCAAFFGRVGRKSVSVPGGFQNQPDVRESIFSLSSGSVQNKRTQQPAVIKPLDGEPMTISARRRP